MAVNDWGSWALDSTAALQGATVLAVNSNQDGQAISNDTVDHTEVGVSIAVGASALANPVEVYICREVAAGVYEDHLTAYGVTVPGQAASTTYRRAITVPGSVSAFRVRIRNPNTTAGQTVTPTVSYRQAITS